MRLKGWIFLAVRIGMGGVFVISGYQKLASPVQNFIEVIEKFELVHGSTASLVAHTLPWLEFIGGVFLAAGLWTRLSIAALWAMNLTFIVLLATSLLRRLPLDQCGCFGEAVTRTVPQMLALDCFFFVVFAVLWRFHAGSGALSLDDRLSSSRG